MTEKAAAKTNQNKNKKTNKSVEGKKKNLGNGVKQWNEHSETHHVFQKKKEKNSKNQSKSSSKRKSGASDSWLKKIMRIVFLQSLCIVFLLGFFYVIDYEKFVAIKTGAGVLLNRTMESLPKEVVVVGKTTVEIVTPVVEVASSKVKLLVNEGATFLNTNPHVKDYWVDFRDITSLFGKRLIEYIRTIYNFSTGAVSGVKSKIF